LICFMVYACGDGCFLSCGAHCDLRGLLPRVSSHQFADCVFLFVVGCCVILGTCLQSIQVSIDPEVEADSSL